MALNCTECAKLIARIAKREAIVGRNRRLRGETTMLLYKYLRLAGGSKMVDSDRALASYASSTEFAWTKS